jgi:hypothetical protein
MRESGWFASVETESLGVEDKTGAQTFRAVHTPKVVVPNTYRTVGDLKWVPRLETEMEKKGAFTPPFFLQIDLVLIKT